MVLVSYTLYNHISLLQTKISDREGHEARHIGPEAIPLTQHIEGGHGEREPGVEIRPHAVHDPLAMTDERQHREHALKINANFLSKCHGRKPVGIYLMSIEPYKLLT